MSTNANDAVSNPEGSSGLPIKPKRRPSHGVRLVSLFGMIVSGVGIILATLMLVALTLPEDWMHILGMYRQGALPSLAKPYLLVSTLLGAIAYVLLFIGCLKVHSMHEAGRLLMITAAWILMTLGVAGLVLHWIWLGPQVGLYVASAHADKMWSWLPDAHRHWWATVAPWTIEWTLVGVLAAGLLYGIVTLVAMSRPATVAAFRASDTEVYQIGTLRYSMTGLFVLFGWLLWGDFCFQLMETVIPHIFPLYLQKVPDADGPGLSASATVTTVLYRTIPAIFGIIIGPVVAFKSDRHRGKWGRRIPYIFWTIPLMVIPLVGLGFSDDYHQYFLRSNIPAMLGISPLAATLTVIGFFMVIFAFGNEFVNTVFWFLYADTVPQQFLARFLSLFRVVSNIAIMLFNFFLVPYMLIGMRWVYIGAAVLYAAGFAAMCLFVKEGEYPPPEVLEETKSTGFMGNLESIWIQIKTYVTQCFRYPIYWATYSHTILSACAGAASIGMGVFTLQALHVSLKVSGPIAAGFGLIGIALAYPCGWLADRFQPMRMLVVLSVLSAPISLACFFLLNDLRSWVIFGGINLIYGGLTAAATAPFLITIFPRDKFGQFASCNGTMKSLAMLVVPLVGAEFIDYMVINPGGTKLVDNYRWAYVWSGVFQLLSWLSLVWVYVLWKRNGGAHGYIAPGSAEDFERQATLTVANTADGVAK